MMINLEDKVKDIFKRKDFPYDYNIVSKSKVEVSVEWGDWKHDHIYLDYCMKVNGFKVIDEVVTEEDGSDCYSSVHTYQLAKYCR